MQSVPDRQALKPVELSDDELLQLFHHEPERAWRCFLDRHADPIFRQLQRLGFDYDQAMDRFVYVCEKLSENGFRRMRAVRHTGSAGELTPWLRTVVERLSINWLWSQEGRDRLFRPLESLSAFERRVFELHFRHGLTPGAIHEQLRVETQRETPLASVFDALDAIHARLSPNRIWRLVSQLARSSGPLSLDSRAGREDDVPVIDPADPALTPEEILLQREESAQARSLIDGLPARDRLILRMRYDDTLDPGDIATLLQISENQVRERLRATLRLLREAGASGALSVESLRRGLDPDAGLP